MMGNMASTTAVQRTSPRRKKGLQPETAIQVGVITYLKKMMHLQNFQRFMVFHVPNGGKRNPKEAALLEDMGVMPGVADLVLLIPSVECTKQSPVNDQGYAIEMTYRSPTTVFIELKHQPMRVIKRGARKDGIVKAAPCPQHQEQKDFQARVQRLGFDYRVIAATDARDGLNQVIAVLAEYGVRT